MIVAQPPAAKIHPRLMKYGRGKLLTAPAHCSIRRDMLPVQASQRPVAVAPVAALVLALLLIRRRRSHSPPPLNMLPRLPPATAPSRHDGQRYCHGRRAPPSSASSSTPSHDASSASKARPDGPPFAGGGAATERHQKSCSREKNDLRGLHEGFTRRIR